jgi:hypothetical protein
VPIRGSPKRGSEGLPGPCASLHVHSCIKRASPAGLDHPSIGPARPHPLEPIMSDRPWKQEEQRAAAIFSDRRVAMRRVSSGRESARAGGRAARPPTLVRVPAVSDVVVRVGARGRVSGMPRPPCPGGAPTPAISLASRRRPGRPRRDATGIRSAPASPNAPGPLIRRRRYSKSANASAFRSQSAQSSSLTPTGRGVG